MARRFRIQAPQLVTRLVNQLSLRGEFQPHLLEDVQPVVQVGGELAQEFQVLDGMGRGFRASVNNHDGVGALVVEQVAQPGAAELIKMDLPQQSAAGWYEASIPGVVDKTILSVGFHLGGTSGANNTDDTKIAGFREQVGSGQAFSGNTPAGDQGEACLVYDDGGTPDFRHLIAWSSEGANGGSATNRSFRINPAGVGRAVAVPMSGHFPFPVPNAGDVKLVYSCGGSGGQNLTPRVSLLVE